MKTKGGSSDKEKALENLKYIIFLLLHLDNNNYNKIIKIEEEFIDKVDQRIITPGRPKDKILKIIDSMHRYNSRLEFNNPRYLYNTYAKRLQKEIDEDEKLTRKKKKFKDHEIFRIN